MKKDYLWQKLEIRTLIEHAGHKGSNWNNLFFSHWERRRDAYSFGTLWWLTRFERCQIFGYV